MEWTPIDPKTTLRRAWHIMRWAAAGCFVGLLAGLSSYAFLESLKWATDLRLDHPWLPWTLPVVGFGVGLLYHHIGGRAAAGNDLLLEEIHEPQAWVPRRMAPLIFVATVVGHIAGASIGREGTAIQMAGGLTDGAARLAKVSGEPRRLLLITAIAGGFGAVFGVPLAGCVFALEVQSIGRLRYDALVPCLAAAVVGDRVVAGLGYEHDALRRVADVDLTAGLITKVVVAGICFGLVASAFSWGVHTVGHVAARLVSWPPLRPVLGAVVVLGLMGVSGTRAYLGLSTDVANAALAGGVGVATMAFAWKLVFTSVSLGSGFRGGEVTPLFVIGATLGATLGTELHAPVPLFAAIGFVAVFGAAANTPLACAVMALELFGPAVAVPAAIACVVAYVCSTHQGIYRAQRIDTPKAPHRP